MAKTLTGKNKLSITLDESIVRKLPRDNKSLFIEETLRQRFQNEGVDKLYAATKQKLLQDPDFLALLNPSMITKPLGRACCGLYPNQCRHWVKVDDQILNSETGEVMRELG